LNYSSQAHSSFDAFTLPMIKLHEKGSDVPLAQGYAALAQMIHKRADPAAFTSDALVDKVIRYSGGNPRELFKLLHYAFLRVRGEQFDDAAVEAAIQDLATDYKRVLDTDDYSLLVEIDQNQGAEQNSERIRHFLYNLLLLEYNGFWRETHPVVKTLAGYQQALKAGVE